MKKIGRISFLIFLILVVAAMVCGCSSAASGGALKNEANYDTVAESAKMMAQSAGKSEQVAQSRKIIEYITLTVETKTFDRLIEEIHAAVKQAGGYMENSEIGGNSYYGDDNRSADLKIRIPKTKQADFSDFIADHGNVVNRSVNTEDVTDQYIDTQSRIKALTLEKETLEKLLAQSSSVADTLTVYEKLTDVIAEIESYQGRLNQMDNLIEYTTFTIHISEVEKETQVEKQNWFAKTWNGLMDNFANVGNGLLDFLSFSIMALPYWILIVIIVLVILVIIRRRKKQKAKQ